MQLTKVEVSGELRVTYNNGVEVWDKEINLFSSATKSKCMSDFHDLFWYQFTNGMYVGANISEDLAITDQLLAVGDGSATAPALGDLSPSPVKPNSITITTEISSTTTTVTDDGAGNLTGSGSESGTINYATGAVSITWDAAPDNDAPITADFTRGIASDDSLVTGFTFEISDDSTPPLDDSNFSSTIPLTIAPAQVDRFDSDTHVTYLATMTASYTGANTSPITALSVLYKTVTGTGAGVVGSDRSLVKSIALNGNTIYDSSELILMNACAITVTYRVKVAK